MLKYLIIPLTPDAVSFCQYSSAQSAGEWISEATLRDVLFWAMKENVSVQFVYPVREVPLSLVAAIESIDHATIVPFNHEDKRIKENADIVVFERIAQLQDYRLKPGQAYVVKLGLESLLEAPTIICEALQKVDRLNIVLDNISAINHVTIDRYQQFLESLVPYIIDEYKKGHQVQFNLLTDRLMLKEMNNCNAGYESLTFAPDGKFYICPGFYNEGKNPVGDLEHGVVIKNQQLFKLSHAPICRICDAWHCKRCVWMNKMLTREVNTPSREQCVTSHIERHVSQKLLAAFREIDPSFLPEALIPDIDYLDPFDKLTQQ